MSSREHRSGRAAPGRWLTVSVEDDGSVSFLLKRENRTGAYSPAAAVGAELRLGEQLLVSAEMRRAQVDEAAALLRGDGGPVRADPVTIGASIGRRFR